MIGDTIRPRLRSASYSAANDLAKRPGIAVELATTFDRTPEDGRRFGDS